IPLFFRSLPLIVLLGMMGAMGYGQLVPNTYTSLTEDNFDPDPTVDTETSGIGSVINADNVLIAGTSSSATLSVGANGSATLIINLDEAIPAGSYAGFVIQSGITIGSAFDISVSNNGANPQTVSGGNLLELGIGGQNSIGFYSDNAFNTISITYSGLLGSVLVYYAEVMVFEDLNTVPCNNDYTLIGRPDYPVYVNPDGTGFTGATLGTINNIDFAVDNDQETAATIQT